jgi:hypothetical protein
VLPIGVTFALPTVWLNTPTILVAILPLIPLGAETPAGRWLRAGGGVEAAAGQRVQRVRRRLRWAGLVARRGIAAAVAPRESRRSNG